MADTITGMLREMGSFDRLTAPFPIRGIAAAAEVHLRSLRARDTPADRRYKIASDLEVDLAALDSLRKSFGPLIQKHFNHRLQEAHRALQEYQRSIAPQQI
jgi:DNA-binding response OmpR family regulator